LSLLEAAAWIAMDLYIFTAHRHSDVQYLYGNSDFQPLRKIIHYSLHGMPIIPVF